MLYRVVVGFLWVFWLVMVTLLIRTEYFSEEVNLYRLPVQFVGSKIFRSDIGSQLTILYKGTVVGKMHVDPAPPSENLFRGGVNLDWPVLGKQLRGQIFFNFHFTPSFDVQNFSFIFDSQELTLNAEGSQLADLVRIRLKSNEIDWKKDYKWTELEKNDLKGVLSDINQTGTQTVSSISLPQTEGGIRWYGVSTNLKLDNKKIEAFLIASEGSRDYWVKIWLSPTGEILLVKTSPVIGITMENTTLL